MEHACRRTVKNAENRHRCSVGTADAHGVTGTAAHAETGAKSAISG
nr:hypothetical protein [Agrobacterium sp. rho-13.3]MDX8310082.1 hypothetical protein [Agrobacterium sp. rho-13.3]